MATRTDIAISAALKDILCRCTTMRDRFTEAHANDEEPQPNPWQPTEHQLVDGGELEHWQETFGVRFPRDLLALEAVAIAALRSRVSVSLAPLVLEKAYRQQLKVPKGWVVVGVARGAGFRESIAIGADEPPDEDPPLMVVSAQGTRETRLCELLNERLASANGWAEAGGSEVGGIHPAVIDRVGSASLGRRVSHKKFGEGTVLKEMAAAKPEDVKLEIEFEDVGVKVLLARFVTEAGGAESESEDDGSDPGPRLADGPFPELAKAVATRLGMIIAPDFIKALSSVPRQVFAEKLYWTIHHPGLWAEAGDAISSVGWLEDMAVRTDSVRDGRYRGAPGIAIGRAAGGEILCLTAKNKRGGGPLERLAQIDHESLELEPVGGTFGSAEDLWNVLRESGILSGD